MPWNQIHQDIEAEKAYNFCQCGIINIREIEKKSDYCTYIKQLQTKVIKQFNIQRRNKFPKYLCL